MINAMGLNASHLSTVMGGRLPETAGLESGDKDQAREAFHSFVGETFYGQMLKAMRSAQGKPAYFHGGRAEEVFQGQLDQILAQEMTRSDAGGLSESLYKAFSQIRRM